MKSLFEQKGGTYSTAGDYRVPNLTVQKNHHIGVWGKRRLDYLKHHRRIFYVNLMTSGKLHEHLQEIDVAATECQKTIISQMAAAQGMTEQFKAENQMLWVGMMNNIYACVDEIIKSELIYS